MGGGSGNTLQHGTQDVTDTSGDPSAVLTDKSYTYNLDGTIETKTEVLSSGVTIVTTYSWTVTGDLLSSNEEYL